jgi:hypothetical protein
MCRSARRSRGESCARGRNCGAGASSGSSERLSRTAVGSRLVRSGSRQRSCGRWFERSCISVLVGTAWSRRCRVVGGRGRLAVRTGSRLERRLPSTGEAVGDWATDCPARGGIGAKAWRDTERARLDRGQLPSRAASQRASYQQQMGVQHEYRSLFIDRVSRDPVPSIGAPRAGDRRTGDKPQTCDQSSFLPGWGGSRSARHGIVGRPARGSG